MAAQLDATGILGLLAYWLVILAALMVAFNSMGLANVTDLLGRIVLFVPKVMVAVLVIAFGAYFARFIGVAVTTYCRNVGIGDAGVLGRLAFYAILVFVVLIALDQLGLGDIIRQTFLIVVGAVALGLALGFALAFGLGGQHRAAELLERWSRRKDERTPPTGPEAAGAVASRLARAASGFAAACWATSNRVCAGRRPSAGNLVID